MPSWSSGQFPLLQWEFPQLLWDRRFEPRCHPVLELTVTIDISKTYAVLLLLATLQTKDARICIELHRELPAMGLQQSEAWSITTVAS